MIGRLVRFTLQALGLLTLVCLVAAGAMGAVLGSWLQYETPLERADYIVPLAGDSHRLLKAIELYKQGHAPTILLSNGRVRSPSRLDDLQSKLGNTRLPPHETRRKILDFMQVPPAATAEFGNGHVSTVEEAEALRRYIGARAATIVIVTSPYHTRRAKIVFESVMPEVKFMVASPPEGRLADPWWKNQDSAQLVVAETAKLVFFWLGGAFRTLAPAS